MLGGICPAALGIVLTVWFVIDPVRLFITVSSCAASLPWSSAGVVFHWSDWLIGICVFAFIRWKKSASFTSSLLTIRNDILSSPECGLQLWIVTLFGLFTFFANSVWVMFLVECWGWIVPSLLLIYVRQDLCHSPTMHISSCLQGRQRFSAQN